MDRAGVPLSHVTVASYSGAPIATSSNAPQFPVMIAAVAAGLVTFIAVAAVGPAAVRLYTTTASPPSTTTTTTTTTMQSRTARHINRLPITALQALPSAQTGARVASAPYALASDAAAPRPLAVAGWAAIFGAAAGAYGMAVKRATSSTALQHHDQEEAPITPALLLDCDGTIVDTERDGHRVAFNQAFKEKGLVGVEWSVELYGELLTTGGGKERMARYFTDYNPSAWPDPTNPPAKDHPLIMDLHKLKTKLFMDIIESGSLPLRPGIQEVVDAAIAAGWQTAVCSTSNEKAVQAVVDKLLDGKIKHIFAGDMVPKKKPDPAIYNMAAQELSLDPNHCVVVEDSRIGLLAARAAGMACIVTKSTYTGGEDFTEAQLVVDDMGSTGLDKVEALIA